MAALHRSVQNVISFGEQEGAEFLPGGGRPPLATPLAKGSARTARSLTLHDRPKCYTPVLLVKSVKVKPCA